MEQLTPAERDNAAAALAYAFDSQSDRGYMLMIADAFSGRSNLDVLDQFLATTFEMPDLSGLRQEIFEGVTNYLRENGAALELPQETIDAVVEAVQNELRAERGPDFYKLPEAFKLAGLTKEQSIKALSDLQDFLGLQLGRALA
jgi:hypothetical protein